MSDEFKMPGDEELDEPTMTLPAVGGVRITGAKAASDDPLADWDLDQGPVVKDADLPHWSDEPTGQVPAVLDREGKARGDDPFSNVTAPIWREGSSDWSDDSEAFDSLIATPTEGPVGALNPERVLEESQPWEFDLEEIPRSRRREPRDAGGDLTGAEGFEEPQNAWDLGDLPPMPPPMATPAEPRRRGGRSSARDAELSQESPERIVPPREPRRPRGPRTGGELPPSGGTGRDLPVAIITGVVIAALVMVTFDIGTLLAMVLVVAVVTVAAAEVFAAFRRSGEHPATLLGLVATISLLVASYNKGIQAVGLVTVLLFAFTVIWFLVGVEKADSLRGLASTMLVFVWVGVFGSYAALLLNPNLFPNRHGLAFLLGAILVSVTYDIAALFIGSSLGRHPMASEVSPNKTWEGLAGGTVAAILMSVIVVQMIHPWTLRAALTLGIVVSIVAPLGDLAESMIKRQLGLKDMGRLLPGHGGVLDRVDGLLFVLPATFYLLQAFHLS
jgi:CDP-diglyceride synthetase